MTLDTGLTPLDSGLGVDSLDYCPLDSGHWTRDSGLWTLDAGLSGIFNPSPVIVSSMLIKLLAYTKIVMYTRDCTVTHMYRIQLVGKLKGGGNL